jgi:gliding motility-associated-like protein
MQKLNILPLLALFLVSSALYAQKEGNIWHFGKGYALDFNSGTPVASTVSSMWTVEGCASICDANGNLLFYTNGGGRDPITSGQPSGKIWNRNHEVMYDMGNAEGGGNSAIQSAVIIPKPEEPDHYYVFTMEEFEFDEGGAVLGQPQGRGLSYFEVDMALNGGLGGVVSYTPMYYVPSIEGLCAVRHTNGSDYWIIINGAPTRLVVFPVNASGVGAPEVYGSNNQVPFYIKGSPDGKWVMTPGKLFPFDATTGIISEPVQVSQEALYAEFSPNSKRLFSVSNDEVVYYYDLTSPNIESSVTIINQIETDEYFAGQMQLASDGNIYFTQISTNDSVFISVIQCPNLNPVVEEKIFSYGNLEGSYFIGLPNFDNAIFRNNQDALLPISLGSNQVLCAGQSATLYTDVDDATFNWSNGAQTPIIQITTPGTYTVTATNIVGCAAGVDSIVVTASDLVLETGADEVICVGEVLPLSANTNGTVTWLPANQVSNATIANPNFTGNTDTQLIVTSVLDGCTLTDTVNIEVAALPTASVAPSDTTINSGAELNLTATPNIGTYAWAPTVGLSCIDCPNPIATPTETTTYTVTITNESGCTATASVTITVTPPICNPLIPNAFTPDNDGINDTFKPLGPQLENFNVHIYNRWGQKIYDSNQPWDGRVAGADAPVDVYIYKMDVLICGEQKTSQGEIILIR